MCSIATGLFLKNVINVVPWLLGSTGLVYFLIYKLKLQTAHYKANHL